MDRAALIGTWRMTSRTRTVVVTGEKSAMPWDDRLVISDAPGTDPVTGEDVIYRLEFCKL